MNLKEIHEYLTARDITDYAIQMNCHLVANSFEFEQFRILGIDS